MHQCTNTQSYRLNKCVVVTHNLSYLKQCIHHLWQKSKFKNSTINGHDAWLLYSNFVCSCLSHCCLVETHQTVSSSFFFITSAQQFGPSYLVHKNYTLINKGYCPIFSKIQQKIYLYTICHVPQFFFILKTFLIQYKFLKGSYVSVCVSVCGWVACFVFQTQFCKLDSQDLVKKNQLSYKCSS